MCRGRGRPAWGAGPPAGSRLPTRTPRRKHRGRAADSGSDIKRDRPRTPISPLSRVPSTCGDLRTLRLRPRHLLGRVRSGAPKASPAGSGAALPSDPSWRRQARRAAAPVSRATTSASDACARRRPERAPAPAPGRRLDVDHAGPWTLRAVRDRIVRVLPRLPVLFGTQELASGGATRARTTSRFARGSGLRDRQAAPARHVPRNHTSCRALAPVTGDSPRQRFPRLPVIAYASRSHSRVNDARAP
jgi:hypothetical protein